ncbi:MAG: hypothetical protein AAB250_19085 [Bdellovibrionota bacterium]|mgnify:CR=1 FL=1
MMNEDGKRDLKHFLKLAAAQINHRLKLAEASEPYSARINRMRALEELIKEQVPANAEAKANPRPPAGTAG